MQIIPTISDRRVKNFLFVYTSPEPSLGIEEAWSLENAQ
jgi:hypothetical protein